MARGLSEQQRRILTAAYAAYRNAAERNREYEASKRRYHDALRTPQPWGPLMPLSDMTHGYAALALHGWCSGDRAPGGVVRVYADYRAGFPRPKDATVIATISREEYETAHVSVARTLVRLVARGLLEPHGYYRGYNLTQAGVRWCAGCLEQAEAA